MLDPTVASLEKRLLSGSRIQSIGVAVEGGSKEHGAVCSKEELISGSE